MLIVAVLDRHNWVIEMLLLKVRLSVVTEHAVVCKSTVNSWTSGRDLGFLIVNRELVVADLLPTQ